MRPATPEPCYCHSVRELVDAGLRGIDLHAAPEPMGASSGPAIALNNDAALAGIATGGRLRTTALPDWADNFKSALNTHQEN